MCWTVPELNTGHVATWRQLPVGRHVFPVCCQHGSAGPLTPGTLQLSSVAGNLGHQLEHVPARVLEVCQFLVVGVIKGSKEWIDEEM